MRESVVFQEILEEGRIEGREEGAIAFTAKWPSPLETIVAIVTSKTIILHIICKVKMRDCFGCVNDFSNNLTNLPTASQ